MFNIKTYTYSQLLSKVDSKPKGRSKGIVSHYSDTIKEDTVIFVTLSKVDGRPYYQYIKFLELPDTILPFNDMKQFLSNVDIKMFCTCQAFKYFCSYTADKMKSNYGNPDTGRVKTKPPRVKKPQGPACKHLTNVLRIIPFNWNKIIKDMGAFIEDRVIDEVYGIHKDYSFISLDQII